MGPVQWCFRRVCFELQRTRLFTVGVGLDWSRPPGWQGVGDCALGKRRFALTKELLYSVDSRHRSSCSLPKVELRTTARVTSRLDQSGTVIFFHQVNRR